MPKYVLDATALLALINNDPGSEEIERCLHDSTMSAINVAECAAVLTEFGIPSKDIEKLLKDLIPEITPFDETQAFEAARLRSLPQAGGLSFGDRACLALGKKKKLPIITADKVLASLDL